MGRKITILVIMVLVFCQGQISPIRAASAPILINISRDVWSWAGPGSAPKSLTQWGYNYDPILSPDGTQIAYKSTATVAVSAIKAGQIAGGAGDLPSTIWLLDVATGDAKRIANQPDSASFSNPNSPDNYILRSEPSWSPDGKSLAWTELYIATGNDIKVLPYKLVVYTVASGTTKTIVSKIPPQQNYEGYAPMQVLWGVPGIAVLKLDAVTDASGLYTQGTILVYDPKNGKLIKMSPPVRDLVGFVWMTTASADNEWAVSVIAPAPNANTFTWKLFSLIDGNLSDLDGVPELYNPNAPEGLSIYASEAGSLENWQITSQAGDAGMIPAFSDISSLLKRVTISPDGGQVAYVNADASSVVVDNGTNPIYTMLGKNLGGIAWGRLAWRVRATAHG